MTLAPLADYDWLPADMRAFIQRTLDAYPADAVDFTIAQQRAFYDAMCARFDPPHPEGLATEDITIADVPCRRYVPTAPRPRVTAVFFHGGGFIVGGLHSHDSICAELAVGAQTTLIAVDYRLVPEHRHPAAYDDCLAVVAATQGPKVLIGDSAGGNLAASVSATIPGGAEGARIIGQVLIYPGLGGDLSLPSYTRHAHAPLLTRTEIAYYADRRFDGPRPDHDVTAAPLDASEYTGLPATAIFTAECDPLASDGAEYAARLARAGVPVELTEEPGMVHGYLRARHMAQGARASFSRITRALESLAMRASP